MFSNFFTYKNNFKKIIQNFGFYKIPPTNKKYEKNILVEQNLSDFLFILNIVYISKDMKILFFN